MTDHLPECMTPDDPCADPESCDSLACARQRLHLTLRDEADQREGDHLPECAERRAEWRWSEDCICLELRACEARVEESMDRAWTNTLRLKQAEAYAKGVQAARDAVAAASLRIPYENRRHVYLDDAVAAIDALRGEA